MAISVADYGSAYWLGVLFGRNPVPSGYWVALLTGDADEGYDGTVLADVEPPVLDELGVASGYVRVFVPVGASNWIDPEGGYTANALEFTYPVPTTDWDTITGWALCTAATGGELYAFGEFDNPLYVATGNQLTVGAGGLTITMTGPTNTIVM